MRNSSLNQNYSKSIAPFLRDFYLDSNGLTTGYVLARNHLLELRSTYFSRSSISKAEEIYFFKYIRSVPHAHLIYFVMVKDFREGLPVLSEVSQLKYIRKRMLRVNEFFKKHTSFIEYVQGDKTHLDEHYFCQSEDSHMLASKYNLLNPDFTTGYDGLLAHYKALLLYKDYLQHEMAVVKGGKSNALQSELKWTGQKVDLIELIYALHASGVFNEGNTSVRKIASFLQEAFDCPLGDIYRSYHELRYRKRIRTKFLDKLSRRLVQKMDQEDLS